jgi:hypothetical protein
MIDKGWITQDWGQGPETTPKITLVFQTEERNEKGYRYKIFLDLTVSASEKSNMVKHLSSWLGEGLKKAPLDFETLPFRGASLNVGHKTNPTTGRVKAIINSIAPMHPKDELLQPEDYIRMKDRDDWVAPEPSAFEPLTPQPAAAAPQPAAAAPAQTAQAPAQATLPTTEAAPPDVTPQPKAVPTKTAASQQPATEEELDKFMLYAMDLFDDDKAMGFIQEAAMKITKQDDIRQLTSNQLYQAKMELRNRKPTDFKVKKMELPKAPPLTADEIADGLGVDPFEDE